MIIIDLDKYQVSMMPGLLVPYFAKLYLKIIPWLLMLIRRKEMPLAD